jgi:hypothetical protein
MGILAQSFADDDDFRPAAWTAMAARKPAAPDPTTSTLDTRVR